EAGFGASEIIGNADREGFAVTGKGFARLGRCVGDTGLNGAEFTGEAALNGFKTARNSPRALIKADFGACEIFDNAGCESFTVTGKGFARLGRCVGDTGLNGAEFTGEAALNGFQSARTRPPADLKADFGASEIFDNAGCESFTVTGKGLARLGRSIGNARLD